MYNNVYYKLSIVGRKQYRYVNSGKVVGVPTKPCMPVGVCFCNLAYFELFLTVDCDGDK